MDRIAQLNEFLAANPTDSFLRHALGLEYLKRGDEQLACDTFINLLQTDPGYVGTYYQLAKLLEKLNRTEDAIETYKKGMIEAEKAGDRHSWGELRSALEELTF